MIIMYLLWCFFKMDKNIHIPLIIRKYNSCERKHIETSKCQENVWHKLYVLLNFYTESVANLWKIFIGHLKHLLLNTKRSMKYGKEIRKKHTHKKTRWNVRMKSTLLCLFCDNFGLIIFKVQRSSSAINLELAKHVQV